MEQITQTPARKTHAWERVEERLTEAGFDAETRRLIFVNIDRLASMSQYRSEAIRVLELPTYIGEYGDRSNGNEVWAIVRGRRLVTVMLRRAEQARRPSAFDVEAVTIIG